MDGASFLAVSADVSRGSCWLCFRACLSLVSLAFSGCYRPRICPNAGHAINSPRHSRNVALAHSFFFFRHGTWAKATAKPWAFGFSAPDKFPVLVLRQAITLWFYSKCHLKRTAGRRDAFFFFLAGLKNYQSMAFCAAPLIGIDTLRLSFSCTNLFPLYPYHIKSFFFFEKFFFLALDTAFFRSSALDLCCFNRSK